MKELISLGFVHIYFFGVMIAIGIIAGVWLAMKIARERHISEDTILNFAIFEVIAGIVGARLFFIMFYNPSYYIKNPSEILKITEGGLSIHGGIFFALVVGIIFSKKYKISFFKLADIAAIAVILAQGIGRVGCDVFGKAMVNTMPWGIVVNGKLLHPVQIYEFILNFILFIYLWDKSERQKYDGELFVTYIIAFSIIRGIVEFFRINPLIWGPFSVSHLLSLIFIFIGLITHKFIKNKEQEFINVDNTYTKLSTKVICLSILIILSLLIFFTVQK